MDLLLLPDFYFRKGFMILRAAWRADDDVGQGLDVLFQMSGMLCWRTSEVIYGFGPISSVVLELTLLLGACRTTFRLDLQIMRTAASVSYQFFSV
jgi:hypothetical protein